MDKDNKTMFKTIALKRAAFALLFAGAVVGAAEAQIIPPDATHRCNCAGGLFTLSDATARFYVSLDDNSSEPGIFVVMRFIDHVGTVVRTRTARIGPGGSAMLDFRGSGLYRVQAEAFDPATNLRFSNRRTVVTSVDLEMRAAGSGPGGLLGDDIIFKWIGPGPIVPCDSVSLQTP